MNVALYRRGRRYLPGGSQWAMTERGRSVVNAEATCLAIGPSSLRWDGSALSIDVNETSCPWPASLKGHIRLTPRALTRQSFALDAGGQHHWWPVAPDARIEVEFPSPGINWSGQGYFDANRGCAPMESAFKRWSWSCARLKGGPVLTYDVCARDGSRRVIAARVERCGEIAPFEPPPAAPLPRSLWRLHQDTRAEAGHCPRIVSRFEDTPFYARSAITTRLLGEEALAMHESLDLDRLSSKLVRLMIPVRNPRALF